MQEYVIVAVIVAVGYLGYLFGRVSGRKELLGRHLLGVKLYRAIDELDVWCGHASPHARLIARHLKAVGDGSGLNAGTPCGEEACTVNGLREQLKRLDEKVK